MDRWIETVSRSLATPEASRTSRRGFLGRAVRGAAVVTGLVILGKPRPVRAMMYEEDVYWGEDYLWDDWLDPWDDWDGFDAIWSDWDYHLGDWNFSLWGGRDVWLSSISWDPGIFFQTRQRRRRRRTRPSRVDQLNQCIKRCYQAERYPGGTITQDAANAMIYTDCEQRCASGRYP